MAESRISPKELEYIGSGIWRFTWDVIESVKDELPLYTYKEQFFPYEPTPEEVKNILIDSINKDTDQVILSGLTWKDMPIWLSQENQINYKAAYDLAVQTDGSTLPVTFQFGETDSPIYCEFTTLEELSSFYISCVTHVQKALKDGWDKKAQIISKYIEQYGSN